MWWDSESHSCSKMWSSTNIKQQIYSIMWLQYNQSYGAMGGSETKENKHPCLNFFSCHKGLSCVIYKYKHTQKHLHTNPGLDSASLAAFSSFSFSCASVASSIAFRNILSTDDFLLDPFPESYKCIKQCQLFSINYKIKKKPTKNTTTSRTKNITMEQLNSI